MRKILKHSKNYLYPHKGNKNHPHLLKGKSFLFLSFFAIFMLGISFGNFWFLNKTVLGVSISSRVLFDLANADREKLNIEKLSYNLLLENAAKEKVDDMITRQYFAHFRDDGQAPWDLILKNGYDYEYAGENLALNFFDNFELQKAWMNSSSHRANLLNPNYKEMGVAFKEGKYNNVNSIYVSQMFGSRRGAKQDLQELRPQITYLAADAIAVRKEATVESVSPQKEAADSYVLGETTQSGYFDNLVYNISKYINYAYILLIFLVTLAIVFRVVVEFRSHHVRQVVIGSVTIVVLSINMYLNFLFI